ncbi:hypothetical protein MML48_3g00003487 [Holotrichia oblita]|uniref:Uncharacterized protein n=1 Tax=Holotrichia oblita TaxID=644536 RepID=A0ACB9TER6_HOLOL|nr:hypothetical protein MML48_3g00003487 [Holotrichia oblita]
MYKPCCKNFSKHLYNVKNDIKGVPLSTRKLLTKTIIEELIESRHIQFYAYGNHSKCSEYLCHTVGEVGNDSIPALRQSGGHHHIYAALNLLLAKSHSLIDNETNNGAELYMNILARFNMGKRLNLIQRDGFQMRSYMTGLRYNEGQIWHSKPWKKCIGASPGKIFKKYMSTQHQKALKRKLTNRKKPTIVKRLKFSSSEKSSDYGPDIAAIVIGEEQLEQEVKKFMERLQTSVDEQKDIASKTIGQFENRPCTSHTECIG